jgi:beta-mannosidase
LRLPKPQITYDVTPAPNGFRITAKTDKFAKAVYFSVGDHDGAFADNYFDLIPGKPIVMEYRSRAPISLKDFRERLSIRSMADAFDRGAIAPAD